MLAILIFEDIAIAFVLAFAAGGGGDAVETFELVGKALAFIVLSLAASRWLARPIDRLLDAMPREFFLIFTFTILVGMAALAHVLGMSEAIGALMGGVILSETSVRAEIEERFLAFRDIFAALFFFVFGLSIDIDELGSVAARARRRRLVGGKMASTYAAGRVGGFTPRQSVNAGSALVARGEFTIILAQLAAANEALSAETRADMVAFAGLYVLATALLGVVLMKSPNASAASSSLCDLDWSRHGNRATRDPPARRRRQVQLCAHRARRPPGRDHAQRGTAGDLLPARRPG